MGRARRVTEQAVRADAIMGGPFSLSPLPSSPVPTTIQSWVAVFVPSLSCLSSGWPLPLMSASRERSDVIDATLADVVGAVHASLSRGQAAYTYRVTYVSDDGLQWRAVLKPNRWWLMPTTLLIRVESEGLKSKVTGSIYVPLTADWGVHDLFYARYLRELLAAIRQSLGDPPYVRCTGEDGPQTRLGVALLIFRHLLGFELVVMLALMALVLGHFFGVGDASLFFAVIGVLIAARVIRSLVRWVNWRGDPKNSRLPAPTRK